MKKIILTTFTDPMMGLSYECEPIFRKLETHYGDQIEFRYVMAGLVRDISDFMLPDELALKPEEGVRKYCQRLAQIYKEEESISGMPVNMDGFHLFDADHRSSYPLNIAYEAARLTAPEKADLYLYRLRYATIVETRQTTLPEELSDIASETGIDKNTFLRHMYSGSAEAAFQQDMQFARSLNIYSLPAYLLQYGEKAILIRQLIGYDQFVRAISGISNSMVQEKPVHPSREELLRLIQKHPLISSLEIRTALNFKDENEILSLLQSRNDKQSYILTTTYSGWFIHTCSHRQVSSNMYD